MSKTESFFQLIFFIGIALSSAKRLRLGIGGFIGPSEILIASASIFFIFKAIKYKISLIPWKSFIISWIVFFLCAIIGCITRNNINDINPPGFMHNLLAFIYIMGICYIFLLEFHNKTRISIMLKAAVIFSTLFYLIPYIIAKFDKLDLLGRPIYFAGWTGGRYEGFTMSPNQMGFVSIILIVIAIYLFAKTKSMSWRTIYLLCTVINIILCFDTRSSSAISALLVIPILLLFSWLLCKINLKKRLSWHKAVTISSIFIIIISLILLWQGPALVQKFSAYVNQNAPGKIRSSWDARRPLYANSFKILRNSPIWGYGFGGHVGHFKNFGGVTDAYESHNTILDIAVTGGLVSMWMWLMLWLRAMWLCWQKNQIVLLTGLGAVFVFSLGNNIMRQPFLWIFILSAILITTYSDKAESLSDA